MKKPGIFFLLMSFVIVAVLGGCKKDDDDDNNNNNTQTAVVSSTDLFNYSDGFGIFAGVNTVTSQSSPIGPIEIELGTAVAAVWNTLGSNTFVAMGDVTCNTKSLTKQSNNSYVFTPPATDATGIDFSSGSSWVISGSADVPSFNFNFGSFPNNPTITSNTDMVTLADGYTFTISGVAGSADSVLYILASGDKYVEKRVAGSVASVTFTASDLSTLSPSTYGLIQVTPYNLTSSSPNGKKYYFVNQVTVSDFAEFK